jgi:hypothetical protein
MFTCSRGRSAGPSLKGEMDHTETDGVGFQEFKTRFNGDR